MCSVCPDERLLPSKRCPGSYSQINGFLNTLLVFITSLGPGVCVCVCVCRSALGPVILIRNKLMRWLSGCIRLGSAPCSSMLPPQAASGPAVSLFWNFFLLLVF